MSKFQYAFMHIVLSITEPCLTSTISLKETTVSTEISTLSVEGVLKALLHQTSTAGTPNPIVGSQDSQTDISLIWKVVIGITLMFILIVIFAMVVLCCRKSLSPQKQRQGSNDLPLIQNNGSSSDAVTPATRSLIDRPQRPVAGNIENPSSSYYEVISNYTNQQDPERFPSAPQPLECSASNAENAVEPATDSGLPPPNLMNHPCSSISTYIHSRDTTLYRVCLFVVVFEVTVFISL